MGLVYFGVVTFGLLALNWLIGYEGYARRRPPQRRLRVARATS